MERKIKAAWLAVIENKGNIKRSLTCASDAGSGLLKCEHNVFDIKSLPAHLREGGFVVSVIERNILSVSKLFIFNKSEHL